MLVCFPAHDLPGFELADDTGIICEISPDKKSFRPLFNLTRAGHLVWFFETPSPANDT